MISDWNYEDFSRWSELKSEWRDICAQEETFWKQKSRLHWLHEGDANTEFFHASVKARRAVARVGSIVDDRGVGNTGVEATHLATVEFFKRLLTFEEHAIDGSLINLISLDVRLLTTGSFLPCSLWMKPSLRLSIPLWMRPSLPLWMRPWGSMASQQPSLRVLRKSLKRMFLLL